MGVTVNLNVVYGWMFFGEKANEFVKSIITFEVVQSVKSNDWINECTQWILDNEELDIFGSDYSPYDIANMLSEIFNMEFAVSEINTDEYCLVVGMSPKNYDKNGALEWTEYARSYSLSEFKLDTIDPRVAKHLPKDVEPKLHVCSAISF